MARTSHRIYHAMKVVYENVQHIDIQGSIWYISIRPP